MFSSSFSSLFFSGFQFLMAESWLVWWRNSHGALFSPRSLSVYLLWEPFFFFFFLFLFGHGSSECSTYASGSSLSVLLPPLPTRRALRTAFISCFCFLFLFFALSVMGERGMEERAPCRMSSWVRRRCGSGLGRRRLGSRGSFRGGIALCVRGWISVSGRGEERERGGGEQCLDASGGLGWK